MEGIKYTAIEDRFGNVELIGPDGRACYFQGDDAAAIMDEWNAVFAIWSRVFGRFADGRPAYRKAFGPFKSYEDHFDAMADQYDSILQ
jgi:hypothetical protein